MNDFKQWLESPLNYYGWKYSTENPVKMLKNTNFVPPIVGFPNPAYKTDVNDDPIEYNYFVGVDREKIEKGKDKLENVLNRTPFSWNIIFYETENKTVGSFLNQIQEYIKENNIQTEGHITFAKNRSSGDPLTTWMIAHTIGHAFDQEDPNATTKFYKIIASYLNKANVTSSNYIDKPAEFLIRYSTFKSAKNSFIKGKNKFGVDRLEELFFETIASYLFNAGKIILKRNPKAQDEFRTFAARPGESSPLEDMNFENVTPELLQEISSALEKWITDSLNSFVGKIIHDFY